VSARFDQVGFSSQRLLKADMEYVARLLATGLSPIQLKEQLARHLDQRLGGGSESDRGSRQKLTTILMNIWVPKATERHAFLQDAANLYECSSGGERLAILWGLVISAYPFWSAVAKAAGRLLNLQETLTSSQVHRRLAETYGDRELVYRATRTVLRSFVDWEVLKEHDTKGVYASIMPIPINDTGVAAWLVEAYLLSIRERAANPKVIYGSPVFFPFSIANESASIGQSNNRIELLRHGLDENFAVLRK